MKIRFSIFAALMVLAAAVYSGAQEKPDAKLDFVPGIYKMTITRDNFDDEEPKVYHYEKCVPFERYQPFEGNYTSDSCEVSNFKRKDSQVSYDIYCDIGLGTGMIGTVSYGYEDETLWWKSYSVGNTKWRIYSFEVEGKAVRVGDCEKNDPVQPF